MSRALREVLEAFASEAVAASILCNALADGGFDAVPESSDDLEEFACGPLRAEVAAVLGEETAEAVVEGLTPIIAMMKRADREVFEAALRRHPAHRAPSSPGRFAVPATSRAPSGTGVDDRRPLPSGEPSEREPGSRTIPPHRPSSPSSARLLDLLVVTGDSALAEATVRRFADRQVAIAETFEALPPARVVVLDTRHAFDALRSTWDVERAPQVAVLWPADARDRSRFEALQPHVSRVVCAGDEAEIDDVLLLVAVQFS